jgi:hypothetical protein
MAWPKGKKHSDEARERMAEAKRGRTSANSGMHWFNNGISELQADRCPEGYERGRLGKAVERASAARSFQSMFRKVKT